MADLMRYGGIISIGDFCNRLFVERDKGAKGGEFIRSLPLSRYSSERKTTAGIAAINWQGSVLLFAGDDDVQCGTMREDNIQWLCELSSTPKVTLGPMIDCLQTECLLNNGSGPVWSRQ